MIYTKMQSFQLEELERRSKAAQSELIEIYYMRRAIEADAHSTQQQTLAPHPASTAQQNNTRQP